MTQPQPTGGFNWARLSMGSKGLLVTGLLFLISLFLPWADIGSEVEAITGIDIGDIPGVTDVSISGLQTSPLFGWLGLLLTLGLLVWEGMLAMGQNIGAGGRSPAFISAILGWAIAACGLIIFIVSLQAPAWGAFLGLILSLAMAYAAYVRFQESKVGTAPPPPAV